MEGALRYDGPAREQAQMIVSALEGAMLVARPYRDPDRFQASAQRLLATLIAAKPGTAAAAEPNQPTQPA
jgi:hypothetical protein